MERPRSWTVEPLGKLKLLANTAKSRVTPLAHCTFLGFRFSRGEIRWSREA